MQHPASILISGASSGIGEALAQHYAASGTTLFLSGRNQERLDQVAHTCRASGADVFPRVINVTDQQKMQSWIEQCDQQRPLDLVVANAGISAGDANGLDETARHLFATNIDGVLNTVHPAVEAMQQQGRGQIAIVSSLAGLIGMPGAPAYSASKAAVRTYGEALRGRCRAYGIAVNVILPGFVVSGITAKNRFPMPFLMPADKAARIIARGLARNKARVAFPWQTYGMLLLISALPVALIDRFFSRLPKKDC